MIPLIVLFKIIPLLFHFLLISYSPYLLNFSLYSDISQSDILCTFIYILSKWIRSVVSNSLQSHGLCNLPDSSVHGIFQEEYWSGLPFPSPGDLFNPGIEPGSPTLQADIWPSEPPGKPYLYAICIYSLILTPLLRCKVYGSAVKEKSLTLVSYLSYLLITFLKVFSPWFWRSKQCLEH